MEVRLSIICIILLKVWKFYDLINGIISNFYIYYTRKSCLCAILRLFFCAKLRNLHCELWKAKSAKLRNKKIVFPHYCAWFHCAKLRNLHCELSCATCAIAQKKKLCAKFSATNRKEKCHCVETLAAAYDFQSQASFSEKIKTKQFTFKYFYLNIIVYK